MKLVHRVRSAAPPAVVWEILGTPALWPQFDIYLTSVKGATTPAKVGQHLVGISRWTVLGIPLDVLEVDPERRLTMRVRTAPGITEELTFVLTPTTKGGTDIRVSLVVEGLFARPAIPLLWLANGVNARVLARRSGSRAKATRRSTETVA